MLSNYILPKNLLSGYGPLIDSGRKRRFFGDFLDLATGLWDDVRTILRLDEDASEAVGIANHVRRRCPPLRLL